MSLEKKLHELRIEAESIMTGLINGTTTLEEADNWHLRLGEKYGDGFLNSTSQHDPVLAYLISSIVLAVIPSEKVGKEFKKSDYVAWFDKYKRDRDALVQ